MTTSGLNPENPHAKNRIHFLFRLPLTIAFLSSFVLVLLTTVKFSGTGGFVPIQSLNTLPIPYFSVSYIIFFACGMLIAFSTKSQAVRVLLIGGFATVILGFWSIKSPLGMYEGVGKLTNVEMILQSGHLAAPQGSYLQWPSLFTSGVVFSRLTGIPGYVFQPFFLVTYSWIIGIVLYSFATKVFGRGFLPFAASVMAMEGNIILTSFYFHPDLLAVVLVIVASSMLPARRPKNSVRLLLVAILGAALVSEDFTGATVLFLLFLMLPVYNWIFFHSFSPSGPLMIYGIMFALWSLYWSVAASTNILTFLSSPILGIHHVLLLYQAGVQAPLWATITRFFWLVTDLGVPLLVALMIIWRKPKELAIPSLFLYSATLAAIASLLGNGTNYFALLVYGPFSGSVVLLFMIRRYKFPLTMIVLVMVAISVPTFFTFSSVVNTAHDSNQEYLSAQFLAVFDQSAPVYNPSQYVSYLNPKVPIMGPPQLFAGAGGSDFTPTQAEAVITNYLTAYRPDGGVLQFAPSNLNGLYHLYGLGIASRVEYAVLSECQSGSIIYQNNQYTICEAVSSH